MPELSKAMDIILSKWLDDFGIKETGGSRYEDKVPPTLSPLAHGPHYWLFEQRQDWGYDGRAGLSIHEIMKTIQSHDMYDVQPIDIPEDWKTAAQNEQPDSVASLLHSCICEYLDGMNTIWPIVLYKPRTDFSTIPYPLPNLTLHQVHDPDLAFYSVEWTILKIFSKGHPGATRYRELGLRSFFDTILPAVCYQIRGCEVLRSMSIAFPQYSSDFGSSTCPDYACRPTRDNLPNGLPNGFTPILFAAHHVKNLKRFEHAEISCVRPGPPERMPDRSQGLVELAKIFQPSLQLLVMHLTKAHCLDGKWDPEWNPIVSSDSKKPPIPRKFFFFGMNYSQLDCIVYAFFPRYKVNSEGRLEWGFCAYEAYTPQPTEGVSPQTRAYLVNTFLRIQRHTAELVNIFKEYSLSL